MFVTQTIHKIRSQSACGVSTLLRTALLLVLCTTGCTSFSRLGPWDETLGNNTAEIDNIMSTLNAVEVPSMPAHTDVKPVTHQTMQDHGVGPYRDMTLHDVLIQGASHGDVIRELGGTVLRNPEQVKTVLNGQLQQTDPRYSVHAALSAFDAQFLTSAQFDNNDRIFNNPFFAGGINAFRQDQHAYKMELFKRTPTGAFLALRNLTDYDNNNAPGNTFPSAWDTLIEGEVRQPLLQGAGVQFNRIAGPGSVPGVYNGVLIARVNSEINQADFEMAVRDYFSNVVNAYWDLYFAYRELDARRRSLDRVRELWRRQKARTQADAELESGSKEALVRSHFFRIRGEVNDALSGRLVQGTQNRNGSPSGTFRGNPGVHAAERRLRLLIGMPINDKRLIRTIEDPEMAEHCFAWNAVVSESMVNRPEIKRQQLKIKRREMELIAAKNYRNPRLEAFGRYRFRGFGHALIADGQNGGSAPESAVGNLGTGDFQEWTMGLEMSMPIGFRLAHAAVSNAEFQLARERAIQTEQQRQIIHDLSNSIGDVQRAFKSCDIQLNRYLAEQEILKSLEAQEENELPVEVDQILDSHRRITESEIDYFRARSEYALAIKNVHYVKGSLLSGFEMGFESDAVAWPGVDNADIHVSPEIAVPPAEFHPTESQSENLMQSPTMLESHSVPGSQLQTPPVISGVEFAPAPREWQSVPSDQKPTQPKTLPPALPGNPPANLPELTPPAARILAPGKVTRENAGEVLAKLRSVFDDDTTTAGPPVVSGLQPAAFVPPPPTPQVPTIRQAFGIPETKRNTVPAMKPGGSKGELGTVAGETTRPVERSAPHPPQKFIPPTHAVSKAPIQNTPQKQVEKSRKPVENSDAWAMPIPQPANSNQHSSPKETTVPASSDVKLLEGDGFQPPVLEK